MCQDWGLRLKLYDLPMCAHPDWKSCKPLEAWTVFAPFLAIALELADCWKVTWMENRLEFSKEILIFAEMFWFCWTEYAVSSQFDFTLHVLEELQSFLGVVIYMFHALALNIELSSVDGLQSHDLPNSMVCHGHRMTTVNMGDVIQARNPAHLRERGQIRVDAVQCQREMKCFP